ncbi:hypothetical protein MAP00_008781 [Monascus purpureus]|nr:hypothetical protein MAP00_008781 [Monascus purpureus]
MTIMLCVVQPYRGVAGFSHDDNNNHHHHHHPSRMTIVRQLQFPTNPTRVSMNNGPVGWPLRPDTIAIAEAELCAGSLAAALSLHASGFTATPGPDNRCQSTMPRGETSQLFVHSGRAVIPGISSLEDPLD